MNYSFLISSQQKANKKSLANKKSPERLLSWQGQKGSNSQQRFWRPTCYHYTMPLRLEQYILKALCCQ